ncbi:MAG TPA: FliM/FliN family flagellar motor switch protein [Bryobacteraceae bacterium]|nr:FliM/FliN family flagellar motor switch protein [Bryobacteraceae bacterium]
MSGNAELAHITDVPLELEVELDRKILTIRSILELKRGSLIRLTRSAGENIDILAGGTLLGYGEIVVIEDRIGVRITDFSTED